jgi:hypothetical protein
LFCRYAPERQAIPQRVLILVAQPALPYCASGAVEFLDLAFAIGSGLALADGRAICCVDVAQATDATP